MSHQYILISISCGDSGESKSFRRWRRGAIIQMLNLIYTHLAQSRIDETTVQKELLLTDDRVLLMRVTCM